MTENLIPYLREQVNRGTPDFQVGFYTACIPLHARELLIHWHEEIEFAYVRSGTVEYDIGRTCYPVLQGDLILIGPNVLHAAHQIPGQNSVTDSVVFPLSLVSQSTKDGCTARYILPIENGTVCVPPVIHPDSPHYLEFLSCFQEMWACKSPQMPYRELFFKSKIFSLIALIWKLSEKSEPPKQTKEFRLYEGKLRLALDHIEKHYAESITIEKLAGLCGFSQVHFMNIFKAALGCTCMEYLVAYRLAKASMELLETDKPIMQIAMDSGFQNVSYFNRAFKRKYSMTPSSYRVNSF